jgi:cob(I)alamin adenosyltransferase
MPKIYTKTGDKGLTSLMGGVRVAKNSLRVEAYGGIDEACSFIGLLRAKIQNVEELVTIQKDLFSIESLLSDPTGLQLKELADVLPKHILDIEKSIDFMTKDLPELNNFILPGGTESASLCHVIRSIVRRAERAVIALSQKEKIDGVIIRYLNRLSDYFFTLSRYLNFRAGEKETIWSRKNK